jgi:hypothetical protein
MADAIPVPVFCSYSHHDHPFREELETQVSPLVRQRLISFWSDRRIAPGEAWEQAIDEKLETAEIVVLLVSAYFVQSDYCYTRELQRALERDRAGAARVIPIFVRSFVWQGLDFAHLQGLPENGKPITAHTDRDEAWTQVVTGIRKVALELRDQRGSGSHDRAPIHATSEPKYDSRVYLPSLSAWYRNAFENIREIAISANIDGRVVAVQQGLTDWVERSGKRFAVVSGEPGSGKTYSFRTLAATLAERYTSRSSTLAPVFVPANRLGAGEPLEALSEAAPQAAGVLDHIIREGAGVILIDGVDEISREMSARLPAFISRLAGAAPQGVRIGLSCRPPVRASLLEAVKATAGQAVDLEIQPLSDVQMQESLKEPSLAPVAIAANLRQPFALSLMALLSERLAGNQTGLLSLYDGALETLIQRERERSIELQRVHQADIFALLTEVAGEMLGRGNIALKKLRTPKLNDDERAALLNALVSAGVLALDARERVTFGHESMFDYFFARLLERELSSWDATHLARSNLIYHYNVNRFLVPMLLRRPARVETAARSLRDELFPETASSTTAAPLVTRRQFDTFMTRSRCRSGVGFGHWGIVTARDGNLPIAGKTGFDGQTHTNRLGQGDEPASGISWYDAQQFAWWDGARTPSAEDCDPMPHMYQWTSEWHDESKALIRLVGPNADQRPAANPDVRSSDIGFRVIPDVRTVT